MTTEDEIQLLLETINAVDEITTIRTDDTNNENVEYGDGETWSTKDYKAELYALIGQKLSEYQKEGGQITIGATSITVATE